MMYTSFASIFALATLGGALGHPLEWYQPRDSPIAELFVKRESNPDDPNFAAAYPPGWSTPPASSLPKAWTDKLASIKMPDIQPAAPNNGYPTYTGGESGADKHICSFTYQCTTSEDLVNPPSGVIALSFDDGPTASSPSLYDFLDKNHLSNKATHFMIGGNILSNPKGMQAAAKAGGHIAVHTWSHQYTTTLSNEGVLAELGWTMQIIADLNGGRIPKYWRPPFGDVDNRVRAIAKGVFGLETVPWNNDSGDWAISTGTYTKAQVDGMMSEWITGSKSPGLNILEHELNDHTVGVFMDAYPKMLSNGWNVTNVADAWGMGWYQNAQSNTGAVASMAVAGGPVSMAAASGSSGIQNVSASMTSAQSASSMSGSSVSGSSSVSASVTSISSAPASSASMASQQVSTTSQRPSSATQAAAARPSGAAGINAQPAFFLGIFGVIAAVLV